MTFESYEALVRRRRSSLRMDLDRPVDVALVERLCELAVWAPNHKATHPWRFTVVTGEGRARLGAAAAEGAERDGVGDDVVLRKLRTKYMRAPVMLLVGAAADDDPVLHAENRDAVAAGIQTMLLGATSLGLASYWSTGEAARDRGVKALAGLAERDQLVGIVYLGWPLGEIDAPERRPPDIRRVT